MHSAGVHTNIANFIYRCFKQNTGRAARPLKVTIVRRSASHAVPDALRPLFATQSVANCIPTQSVGNDNLNYLNYRATLRVACRSGRSASSFYDAERRELYSHALSPVMTHSTPAPRRSLPVTAAGCRRTAPVHQASHAPAPAQNPADSNSLRSAPGRCHPGWTGRYLPR